MSDSQPDPVHKPAHYRNGSIECWDAIPSAIQGLSGEEAWLTGNCIKYLWRWKIKGSPKQDLEKCRAYLERLISKVE